MVETTADVRRDIELTRERMSSTLAELERKLNVAEMVRDHPWPALAVAFGAGVVLSGSGRDIKAAAATVSATKGASSKVGTVLDEVVANLVGGLHEAFESRITSIVDDLKTAIGAPVSKPVANDGSRPAPASMQTPSDTAPRFDAGQPLRAD